MILGRFCDHDRSDRTPTSTIETTGAIAAHPCSRIIARLKKFMAAASPIFRPARPADHHENRANEQNKTEDTLETSIVASPLLLRAWRLRAPSAHPRHPERDSFPSCATRKKKRLTEAHATRQAFADRLRSSPLSGWALFYVVHFSRLSRFLSCLTINYYAVPQ